MAEPVPRTQRSALAVRCRAGAVTSAGVRYGPGSAERHGECRTASGTRRPSTHPQKIPFADLHAVMAQDAVRDRGMEIKVRQGEVGEELLALQRHAALRTGGEFFVARLDA